ncbi:response regulator [Aureimonas endophytica]|uniref:response regulator n=1 Tax=Aureimonas endophytica TaxID=2027858 RepID=UPI001FCEB4B5|nr:response regulator [Aureimonas endophytica]
MVDDDALVAMSLVSLLEDLGHHVVEATSGRQALGHLEDGAAIDLVITDQSMPGMTGTDLARQIAAIRPGLPVMLATGYRDVPDGSDLNLPQLSKPYDDELVAKLVTAVLQGRS